VKQYSPAIRLQLVKVFRKDDFITHGSKNDLVFFAQLSDLVKCTQLIPFFEGKREP